MENKARQSKLQLILAEDGEIWGVSKEFRKNGSNAADKIYSIRDSLVNYVKVGLVSHPDLEDFIESYHGTMEAGLVSSVRYTTSDNFRDMARATEIGFKEKYGFMGCNIEINDLSQNQGLLADHVPYASGWYGNAGKFANNTKNAKGNHGNSFYKANNTQNAEGNYGFSFYKANNTQNAEGNYGFSFGKATNTQHAKGNYRFSFEKATNTQHAKGNHGNSFRNAETPKFIRRKWYPKWVPEILTKTLF